MEPVTLRGQPMGKPAALFRRPFAGGLQPQSAAASRVVSDQRQSEQENRKGDRDVLELEGGWEFGAEDVGKSRARESGGDEQSGDFE